MPKKHLSPFELNRIMSDYHQALRAAKGEKVALETEVSHKSGHFYTRPPGCSPDYLAVPLRPWELAQMIEALRKRFQAP